MLHLETVAASILELLIELQGLDSLRETRLVGGTAIENILAPNFKCYYSSN